MSLRLVRQPSTALATLGRLTLPTADVLWTLEDPPGKDKGPIPAGTYTVELRWSDHFKQLVPWVLAVPGFDDIEIHPGNTEADTRGCILVGLYRVSDGEIAESRVAFGKLLQCWRSWESQTIEIG